MYDLLDFGSLSTENSIECIYHFRHELNRVTEYPVLIVVDDLNMFQNNTLYFDPMFQEFAPSYLPASKLLIPHIFGNFQTHGLCNGIFVGAVNRSRPMRNFEQKFKNISAHPVPAYSLDEFYSMRAFYEASHIAHPPITCGELPYYASSGLGAQCFEFYCNFN